MSLLGNGESAPPTICLRSGIRRELFLSEWKSENVRFNGRGRNSSAAFTVRSTGKRRAEEGADQFERPQPRGAHAAPPSPLCVRVAARLGRAERVFCRV
ncbi:hypothetical protein SRHO_G00068420 [Serrasalmus rhombeus]